MNPATLAAVRAEIEHIAEACGDDPQLLADMLEGHPDFHAIMSQFLRMEKHAQAGKAGAEAAKKHAVTHWDSRIAMYDRAIDSSRRAMRALMADARQRSLKLPEGSVSLGEPKPSVRVADGFNLQGYVRTEIRPDKKAILAALVAGQELPGAELVIGDPILTVR